MKLKRKIASAGLTAVAVLGFVAAATPQASADASAAASWQLVKNYPSIDKCDVAMRFIIASGQGAYCEHMYMADGIYVSSNLFKWM
ncbi:hypothetical protein ACWCPF_26890 [Streptomyces sp. NPDC001858]